MSVAHKTTATAGPVIRSGTAPTTSFVYSSGRAGGEACSTVADQNIAAADDAIATGTELTGIPNSPPLLPHLQHEGASESFVGDSRLRRAAYVCD